MLNVWCFVTAPLLYVPVNPEKEDIDLGAGIFSITPNEILHDRIVRLTKQQIQSF